MNPSVQFPQLLLEFLQCRTKTSKPFFLLFHHLDRGALDEAGICKLDLRLGGFTFNTSYFLGQAFTLSVVSLILVMVLRPLHHILVIACRSPAEGLPPVPNPVAGS